MRKRRQKRTPLAHFRVPHFSPLSQHSAPPWPAPHLCRALPFMWPEVGETTDRENMDRNFSVLSRSVRSTYEVLCYISYMVARQGTGHGTMGRKKNQTQARVAAELYPFLAPSAQEAFSQLPMAVRGSSKITQGVEEMPRDCETLSPRAVITLRHPAQAPLVTWIFSPRRPRGQNTGLCQGAGM